MTTIITTTAAAAAALTALTATANATTAGACFFSRRSFPQVAISGDRVNSV